MSDPVEQVFQPIADQLRTPVIKAMVVGVDETVPAAQSLTPGDGDRATSFTAAGALLPPYEPETLCVLVENSNSLGQNIEAYATNIDAFGHRFEPCINLDADDADERIQNAIYLERVHAVEARSGIEASGVPLPTPEEVAARKEQVRLAMRSELTRLHTFFDYCSADQSFVGIRRRLRRDVESMGNGYLEVLRTDRGQVAQLVYVNGFTVRLLPADQEPTQVATKVKVGELAYTTVPVLRRFRRYVQVWESVTTFFKEFGDPRVVSSRTGRYYATADELQAQEAGVPPATELMHFAVPSPRSPYGVPRWVGNLLSVLGSRQAEEINYLYFDNKSVPPLALLVSGGRLTQETVPRIQAYIRDHIKGRSNFHSILIIEAEDGGGGNTLGGGGGGGGQGRMRIELKPLTSAQQQDALFQKYDERNRDKVGEAFRLPRLLRGDVRDFNRATADAAVKFAEQQVFAPEREDFDFTINRKLLTDMGIRFWTFVSNAPTTRDPEALALNIERLTKAGILTPEEAREETEAVFGRQFRRLDAEWVKQPLQLTLAGMGENQRVDDYTPVSAPGLAMGATPVVPDLKRAREVSLEKRARDLIALRNHLLKLEGDAAERDFKVEHSEDGDTTTLRIPAVQMAQLVQPIP